MRGSARNFLWIVLISFLSGCELLDQRTQYSFGFESTLVVAGPLKLVDSTPEQDSLNVFVSGEHIPEYTDRLSAKGDEVGDVEWVRMSEFGFALTDQDSTFDLNFFKSIEFFLEAPGLDPLKIGQVTDISNGFRGLNVGITFPWETDVKTYLENGYKIRISFTADQQIEDAISFRCSGIFKANIKKFGI
ncbi:MAG: hypothetical protein H6606_02400 [Flavobacteriales bacterium]|nr:hypothetical protein [Flavobacteriales bacterium]